MGSSYRAYAFQHPFGVEVLVLDSIDVDCLHILPDHFPQKLRKLLVNYSGHSQQFEYFSLFLLKS